MSSQRPLTTSESALRAGISARMMRHHVKLGRITPVDRAANTMFFDPKDVDALASRIERRNRFRPEAAA